MLQMALEQYRELYPDVEVELIKPDYDGRDIDLRYELYDQVSAQIMAGEGPDVFLIDQIAMDIEKLVRQGVFADLEPFFEEDNFDWEPYNQAVMDGGVWNGKRFVIPLSYSFPLLFTTRTALEETGFDVDACKDYQGFLEETTRYMQDSTQTRKLFCKPLVTADVLEISGLSTFLLRCFGLDSSGTSWFCRHIQTVRRLWAMTAWNIPPPLFGMARLCGLLPCLVHSMAFFMNLLRLNR